MAIDLKYIGHLPSRQTRSDSETITNLRRENQELREKWDGVLKACCNAEAEVEHLQEQLETADLKLADTNETYRRKVEEWVIVSAERNGLKLIHTREKAELESRISKLHQEVADYSSNYAYAKAHIKDLEKLIQDAKRVTETLRAENKTLLDDKVNSEHLAKQLLVKNNQLNTAQLELDVLRCPYQKTKDAIHIRCGKCSSCKLEASYGIIERTTNNVELVKEEIGHVVQQLNTSKKQVETLKSEIEVGAEKIKQLEWEISMAKSDSKEHAATIQSQKNSLAVFRSALEQISKGEFFNHKCIAITALNRGVMRI